jgi:hypothetical protein
VATKPVALFQPNGQQVPTAEGKPMVVNLPRAGRVLINFSATALAPFALDLSLGRFSYVILVDGKAIAPTSPTEITVGLINNGITLAATAMPHLEAGRHEIQVLAQANGCGTCIVRNQALTLAGPFEECE